jgi:hypothetical protein
MKKYTGHPIREHCYENPSARGAYVLRKPFVLVFIRSRVRVRHHGRLL